MYENFLDFFSKASDLRTFRFMGSIVVNMKGALDTLEMKQAHVNY